MQQQQSEYGTLIHLNDQLPDNPTFNVPWQQLAQLQRMGVKLHMMLGGAACCSYKSLFSNWNKLYPVLKQTLRRDSSSLERRFCIDDGV